MAVDPYSLCPCGSGKKLKFCCPDSAAEIQKIHKMIEGDQPRAALQHVEQVLAKNPGRESLLDLKVMLELTLDDLESAEQTVAEFIKVAPKNPAAYAQRAVLLASRQGGRAGALALQEAMALVDRNMPRRVLDAIGTIGQQLLVEGNIVAARAHLWLYQGISGEDDTRALQLLVRLNQVAGLPLALRDHLYLHPAPEGHPGAGDHDRAQWYAGMGRWQSAAEAFDALCGLYPDQPTFAYNRGLVHGWLGNTEQFVAGLHDYARVVSAGSDWPSEDAVEAEAIAQLLDPAIKDDPIDVVRIAYAIADEEGLMARLAADRRIAPYDIDPNELADAAGPPPRAGYLLLDKPLPESGVAIERDEVPSVVGILSHFGRQTDRAERLELVIDKNDSFDAYAALLAEIGGEALGAVESDERIGESDAAEQALSWRWHFPPDTPPARRRELLADQRREAILNDWPTTPRKALGNVSPRDAAADPAQRLAVCAAVLLLEQGGSNQAHGETFVELRSQLGLPALGPIDPATVDIDQLPLGRVPRLQTTNLSDDDVVELYRRAQLAGAPAASAQAAREAVRRPSLGDRLPRNEAYQRLVMNEPDPLKAMTIVDEARAACDAAGESNALWDLMELELHVVEGQPEEANRVLAHLRAEHGTEPGVAEQLYQLLYALGATPDRMPSPGGEGAPAPPAAQPAAADPSSPIWTPDGESGGGGKKLWTPS